MKIFSLGWVNSFLGNEAIMQGLKDEMTSRGLSGNFSFKDLSSSNLIDLGFTVNKCELQTDTSFALSSYIAGMETTLVVYNSGTQSIYVEFEEGLVPGGNASFEISAGKYSSYSVLCLSLSEYLVSILSEDME